MIQTHESCSTFWELSSKRITLKKSNVRIKVVAKIKDQVPVRIKKSKFKNQKKSNQFSTIKKMNCCARQINLWTRLFFFVFTNCIWKTFHLRLKILHLKQNTFCNFEVRQNNLGKAGKKAMEKRLSFIRTYASSKTGSFPLST